MDLELAQHLEGRDMGCGIKTLNFYSVPINSILYLLLTKEIAQSQYPPYLHIGMLREGMLLEREGEG